MKTIEISDSAFDLINTASKRTGFTHSEILDKLLVELRKHVGQIKKNITEKETMAWWER